MALIKPKKKLGGSLTLATEHSEPVSNLAEYTIWLYGSPGVGKTSTAAQFPSAHFFMFEPGGKALSIRQRPVTTWKEAREYAKLFAKSKFDTAVIDTVELAYEIAFAGICNELGIEHPADVNDMGKSWSRIRDGFTGVLRQFQTVPGKGCVLISHASASKRKTADGDEVQDIHPALSGKPLEYVAAMVDIVAYMHVKRGQRVMQIRPDDIVMAKCRPDLNFLLTDGRPVKYIPMGTSKEQAYQNFTRAFNNELTPEEVAFVDAPKKKVVLKPKKRA